MHAIMGNMSEATAILAQLRSIVEEDWARRRGRRGKTAAATEGTSQASLVVMETLDAYIAAAQVIARVPPWVFPAAYPKKCAGAERVVTENKTNTALRLMLSVPWVLGLKPV